MAFKVFEVPSVGTVKIYRKRGSRHLRLSFTEEGSIRLTMPYWTPYKVGLAFVHQHRSWIASEQKHPQTFQDGMLIAGFLHLKVHIDATTKAPRTRLTANSLNIYVSNGTSVASHSTQLTIRRAIERALKAKAEKMLLPRLKLLSEVNHLPYKAATVKRLKSRWGSCSSKQVITLNSRLVQLPVELIDYVVLHELSHTKNLNHGPNFYKLLSEVCPNFKVLRKELHTYKPDLVILQQQ